MKINLIILASGSSKRFNGNKLLEKFSGKEIYKYTLDKVEYLDINKAIVVTKYEVIKNYALSNGMEVIINNKSDIGISESIKLGINSNKDCDGYIFMVCDQPFIKIESINRLIKVFKESSKGIATLSFNNVLGNPKIFSRKYFKELDALSGDNGGKSIIKDNLDDIDLVEVLEYIELVDVDTKEELNKIKDIDFKSCITD